MLETVIHRTQFIDTAIANATKAPQCVLLGAGLDARPYRLQCPHIQNYWEVDTPNMIQTKSDLLRRTNTRAQAETTLVPVLFDEEAWLDKLVSYGFRRSLPTVFVLEGLVTYLPPEVVEATLTTITQLAKGSQVVLTVRCIAQDAATRQRNQRFSASLNTIGESNNFDQLPIESVGPYFQQLGFKVLEVVTRPVFGKLAEATKAEHDYALVLLQVR